MACIRPGHWHHAGLAKVGRRLQHHEGKAGKDGCTGTSREEGRASTHRGPHVAHMLLPPTCCQLCQLLLAQAQLTVR